MINPTQLRDIITRTLKQIPNGYSNDAVELLMMIAAHESHLGTYLRQMNNGPALGGWEMEVATHDDTWINGDSCEVNASHFGYIWEGESTADKLEYDLQYQILMARQRLFMKPEALPSSRDVWAMADYCKKHWNTVHGKAKATDYYTAYVERCYKDDRMISKVDI
jgi:hypothetical protein